MSEEAALIVKPDRTILLDTRYDSDMGHRKRLSAFAELLKNPGELYLYRLTACSLWSAAAAGQTAEAVVAYLDGEARFGVPSPVRSFIEREWAATGSCGW